MSGYDPADELAGLLEEASAPPRPNRAVSVPPPAPNPSATPPPASTAPVPGRALPPTPGTRRRTTPRPPVDVAVGPLPARSTSANFPLPLLDRLHRLRLDRDVEGRSFNLTASLDAAIDELPDDPASLLAELERYAPMLNVDRRHGDDGFLPEGRLSFRLGATSERRIARLVRDLYAVTRRRINKQDLLALAVLRLLAADDHR